MKIERLNSFTLVAKTNFPVFSCFCMIAAIACAVVIFAVHQTELKNFGAIGLVFFALLTFFIARRSETVFDSRKKELTLSTGSLSMTKSDPVPFSEVRAVKVERSNIGEGTFGRIILVLDDYELPLSPAFHRITPRLEKDAKQLTRFIGCEDSPKTLAPVRPAKKTITKQFPKIATKEDLAAYNFKDIDPKIIELVRKKRNIEAIKLHRTQKGIGLKESKDLIDEIARRIKTGSM